MTQGEQSLTERTFLALADLARRSDNEDITSDLLFDVVCRWTTDPVDSDGIPNGADAISLGAYMIEHLTTQANIKENLSMMQKIASSLDAHNIDADKLLDQDADEWDRFGAALRLGPEGQMTLTDGELTVEDILAVSNAVEVPHEGNWEEVTNEALLEKIDYQLEMNEIMAIFLQATLNNDYAVVHEIIDEVGCELTHTLTNTLLTWVHDRSQRDDEESLEEWVAGIEAMTQQVASLSDEERISFARKHLQGFEEN